jgi:hypothetical protein
MMFVLCNLDEYLACTVERKPGQKPDLVSGLRQLQLYIIIGISTTNFSENQHEIMVNVFVLVVGP